MCSHIKSVAALRSFRVNDSALAVHSFRFIPCSIGCCVLAKATLPWKQNIYEGRVGVFSHSLVARVNGGRARHRITVTTKLGSKPVVWPG